MSISERAAGSIRPLPEREQPISEQYRIVAKAWVSLDGAARMLEGCKEAVLSQMVKAQGDIAVAKAERNAKASPEWSDYIAKMCEARTAANLKRVQLEFLKMRHMEWTARSANARHETRLGGSTP